MTILLKDPTDSMDQEPTDYDWMADFERLFGPLGDEAQAAIEHAGVPFDRIQAKRPTPGKDKS